MKFISEKHLLSASKKILIILILPLVLSSILISRNTINILTSSNILVTEVVAATPRPQGKIFSTDCKRAYSGASFWNQKIVSPKIHPDSNRLISRLSGVFGSDPNQYTYPLYYVNNSTRKVRLTYSGTYSEVTEYGNKLTRDSRGGELYLPIPLNAIQSAGTDSQIIIINEDTGEEWGFYHARKNADGSWSAENGYKYNVNYSGITPAGFGSRGAGVTYLAGLIRKCEVENGKIDHAIAFAYDYPSSKFVYPATKSDGRGTSQDIPEGARLQLNPNATESEISKWCSGDTRINEKSCRMLVRTLQLYGMVLIDGSGHPKIYAEDNKTANWGSLWNSKIPSKIPYSAFRVIDF